MFGSSLPHCPRLVDEHDNTPIRSSWISRYSPSPKPTWKAKANHNDELRRKPAFPPMVLLLYVSTTGGQWCERWKSKILGFVSNSLPETTANPHKENRAAIYQSSLPTTVFLVFSSHPGDKSRRLNSYKASSMAMGNSRAVREQSAKSPFHTSDASGADFFERKVGCLH